jgi:hypothetical protein
MGPLVFNFPLGFLRITRGRSGLNRSLTQGLFEGTIEPQHRKAPDPAPTGRKNPTTGYDWILIHEMMYRVYTSKNNP